MGGAGRVGGAPGVGGALLQVGLPEGPAALHHAGAGRPVAVVGELDESRRQPVVGQLVLAVKGVCRGRSARVFVITRL